MFFLLLLLEIFMYKHCNITQPMIKLFFPVFNYELCSCRFVEIKCWPKLLKVVFFVWLMRPEMHCQNVECMKVSSVLRNVHTYELSVFKMHG